MALQNESDMYLYKNLFLTIAKEKCPDKFTNVVTEGDYWDTFINRSYDGPPVTVGTIKMYAREDNREAYDILHPQEVFPHYLKKFRDMVTFTPKTDIPYAQLFDEMYPERYINCGNTVMEFNGVRFETINEKTMKHRIHKECDNALRLLGRQIKLEEAALDAEGSKDGVQRDSLKNEYRNVNLAYQHIRRETTMNTVLSSLKNMIDLPDYDDRFDSNPYLMGFQNGVMDLRETTFRKAERKDFVTLSTGYKYFGGDEEFNVDTEKDFLKFMHQIYPIEDELNMVQEWMGYCLLGVHNRKFMAIKGVDLTANQP